MRRCDCCATHPAGAGGWQNLANIGAITFHVAREQHRLAAPMRATRDVRQRTFFGRCRHLPFIGVMPSGHLAQNPNFWACNESNPRRAQTLTTKKKMDSSPDLANAQKLFIQVESVTGRCWTQNKYRRLCLKATARSARHPQRDERRPQRSQHHRGCGLPGSTPCTAHSRRSGNSGAHRRLAAFGFHLRQQSCLLLRRSTSQ